MYVEYFGLNGLDSSQYKFTVWFGCHFNKHRTVATETRMEDNKIHMNVFLFVFF